jgi:hypothetical protein
VWDAEIVALSRSVRAHGVLGGHHGRGKPKRTEATVDAVSRTTRPSSALIPDSIRKKLMNAEKKKMNIFVNEDRHEIETHTITYERVVDLYLGEGKPPSKQYVIKYSHGPSENPSGTLAPGEEVKIKDGMRFRVSGTGES